MLSEAPTGAVAPPEGGAGAGASARRIPDDDLLRRIIARGVGDVAIDRAEFGSRERDRDIFGAGVLREALPACAQFEAVLAADDAVVGFAVLGLAVVGDDRDWRGDGQRCEVAFEAVVGLHGEVCDGSHVVSPKGGRGPSPMAPKEGAGSRRHRSVSGGRTPYGVDGTRRSETRRRAIRRGGFRSAGYDGFQLHCL
mgnify:CR=1 FL=1